MEQKLGVKKKWRCTVCGYVCDAEEAPESCPECYAPREAFVEEGA
ncbi:MAG: rubredoxin-like domain-containing protein [Thermodesulfobacteriota bacterium]